MVEKDDYNTSGVASESFRRAEENASASANDGSTSGFSAGEEEANANGLFTGSGKAEGKAKGKGKGFFKRKGPMALIMSLIFGGGSLMMSSQTLMPMAIEEMIIEKFNSVGISSTLASDAWLNVQLNQDVGTTEGSLFAFSENQIQSFDKQGIKVINNVDLIKKSVLLYKKGDSWIPVVGSDVLSYKNYTEQELISAIKSASGISRIGKPISAAEALADTSFKTPYTTASKAWRGGVSGWFDSIMKNITETKLSINRNRWTRWVTKGIKETTAEFNKIAKSVNVANTKDDGLLRDLEVGTEKENGDIDYTKTNDVEMDYDDVSQEDIDLIKSQNGGDGGVDTANTSVNVNPTVAGISKVLNSKAVKAGAEIAEYGCALLEGLVSIYTVVSAYQSMQFLNLIAGFLESVDKVKAGDGDGSPVHEYGVNLTTTGETKDDNDRVVSSNKTAMASAGMAWLFTDSPIGGDDASVRNINFEAIMSNASKLFSNIELTAKVYENCGYVKAGTAILDLATTIISFIPIGGQIVKAAQVTAKQVAKIAIKAAVQIALYAIIPIAAKNLAKMMIKDAATEWFGEDLGNAIISGASKYLGGNGSSGGQSPGSRDKVLAYMNEQNVVIAEEAKYQRSIRSPFDLTSKYTFMGSLFYSIIPLAYSGGGLMKSITDVQSLTTNSLVALLPSANAADLQKRMLSVGDCKLLGSTDAVGDSFCNAYIITDVSTIRESPVAVNSIVHKIGGESQIASNGNIVSVSSDNFNDDGSIKPRSNLGKYITLCGQRTSQYGIRDAAIAESLTGEDTTALKIIGYVPGLNSLKDIYSGFADEYFVSWSNGSACVASSENSHWEENKWYQRYAENERLLENINPDYKSPVTALLENHYKENPVDNSFEGQLARFSGMSKEKVIDTLALIDYYQFLDEYDASTRYAFGKPVVEESHELLFDNDNQVAESTYYVLSNDILFADVRNRVALV